MQVVIVSRELLFSPACTSEMLNELLVRILHMSEDGAAKLMSEKLAKPSKDMANLPHNKARTIIVQKFSQHEFHGADFNAGRLRIAMECLASAEQPKAEQKAQAEAEQPKAEAKATRSSKTGSLSGAYHVAKQRNIDDAGQKAVYDALWSSKTFEEFYEKAPAKSTTRTGRVVTAVNVMGYAIKMGWIVAGEKPQQEQQAEKQAA